MLLVGNVNLFFSNTSKYLLSDNSSPYPLAISVPQYTTSFGYLVALNYNLNILPYPFLFGDQADKAVEEEKLKYHYLVLFGDDEMLVM